MIAAFVAGLALMTFVLGTAVGSFLNVCIYRLPWEKSLFWPGSRCPRCLSAIASGDNVPIVGWLRLRGACRSCQAPIAARYPMVEALTGLLFLAVFAVDVAARPDLIYADALTQALGRMAYHQVLLALLIAATFIDYDLYIIPDSITLTGMALGLGLAAIAPGVRPEPGTAASLWESVAWVGLPGLIVGGGVVWVVRLVGSAIFRREAMGFGDVTLMAMIGAFLGWQAAVLTFFLAPFFGLGHALAKLGPATVKWATGRPVAAADREMPFGPYLSMAAVALMLAWPWLWPAWARGLFATMAELASLLAGGDDAAP